MSKIDGTRHEYIFNSENRMTGYRKYDISSTLLATADYFYDPMGRRIAKSVDGALTRYLYNEEDIWMAVTPGGTVTHTNAAPSSTSRSSPGPRTTTVTVRIANTHVILTPYRS